MKFFRNIFLVLFFLIQNAFSAPICSPKSGVSLPPSLVQSLRFFENGAQKLQFTAEKILANGSSSGLRTSVKIGDFLETKAREKIILRYFIPISAQIILEPNSKIEVLSIPTEKCGSSIKLLKGKLTSDGDHQKIIKNECPPDTATDEAEVFCTGTKYSVDLSEAIAEASDEPLRTENFAVESGSIKIKLRKAKINKSAKYKSANNNQDDNSESLELKANQKAKVKINKKTKFADVEVVEP